MNNNRGNNRRRGRGSNRPQGAAGGGQQLNRIDSRARGNAPQMLEKYRKLAQDAHMNGDRVNAEYYLQFADHYFRVIADTRVRQDEQRRPRDERWPEQSEEGEDNGEFTVESDFPAFEQPVYTRREEREPREPRERGPREPFQRDNGQRDNAPRDNAPRDNAPRDNGQREDAPRDNGNRNASRESGNDNAQAAAEPASEDGRAVYEPAENPFVRENRGTRGLRPRREDRRPRRAEGEGSGDAGNGDNHDRDDGPAMLDAALLPPALASRDEAPAMADEADAPAPKRRGRKPKAVAESEG